MKKDNKNNRYAEAGVDTEKGDALVSWLQGQKHGGTKGKFGKVLESIGGFASLYRLSPGALRSFKAPLLVASTDGVGTKLLLGLEQDLLGGLGYDLVAMCVNDLYTVGARPLFFLDYYATGKLDERQFKIILASIRQACLAAEAPLVGGETAELPGLYQQGHFDLAGFVVGLVDEKKTLGPKRVKKGDHLVGLNSSGFHSNGFSLIRKWIKAQKISQDLLRKLMEPTVIYAALPDIVAKLGTGTVHALAHITGGGISGNLPRVLPSNMTARISWKELQTPEWMRAFIESSGATLEEVEGTFNLGVGMIAVTSDSTAFLKTARAYGLAGQVIGEVAAAKKSQKEAEVQYV